MPGNGSLGHINILDAASPATRKNQVPLNELGRSSLIS